MAVSAQTIFLYREQDRSMTTLGYIQVQQEDREPVIDGRFRLRITRDKLAVHMAELQMPKGGGTPVKVKHVYDALKKLKVKYGIDGKKIDHIVTELNEGRLAAAERDLALDAGQPMEEIGDFCIAKGDAPIHGQHASLRWCIEEEKAQDYVVVPGELIAVYSPQVPGRTGKSIFGTPLNAIQGRDDTTKPGDGVEQVKVDGNIEYRAKWFGTVHINDNTLSVRCPLTILDDGMKAVLDLLPPFSPDTHVQYDSIVSTLNQHRITYGIDEHALRDAVRMVNKNRQPVAGLVVAEGLPVFHGIDARIVYKQKGKVAGQGLAKGRIDFHEHNSSMCFKSGDIIGHLINAKVAQDGTRITGEIIKARPHKELDLKLEGAHLDSGNRIVADVDGVLIIHDSCLIVTELLVIDGDVAQKTGNIHCMADVHVKGHIEPGFELESEKNVFIDKNVEDANVRSGGDIRIKGGIRGAKSEVYAPGSVSVGFVENANVFVNGDICVRDSVINSKISSNGMITVGSKQSRHSAIIGGRTTAKTRIEAYELGSSGYSKTIVSVGFTQEAKQQQRDLRSNIAGMETELVQLERLELHYKLHSKADRDEIMRKVHTTRANLSKELTSLREQLDTVMKEIKQHEDVRIVVHRKIYPGVVIKIQGHAFEVTREMSSGIFSLEDEQIVFHPR